MKYARAKIYFTFLIGCFLGNAALSQTYYFTGAFIDKLSNPVAYVNIKPFRTAISFQAGNTGEFGINSFWPSDSAWCYLPGYDSLLVVLQHGKFGKYMMQMQPNFAEKLINASRLSSLARVSENLLTDQSAVDNSSGESYNQLANNPWLMTSMVPFSGFVPNNNQSSYANIRRFIQQGTLVTPNAVRMEELWNYFNLQMTPPPTSEQSFSLQSVVTSCPWQPAHRLVILNAIAPQRKQTDSLPPINMIFLIDNSGSMESNNRLPLLQSGFKNMVKHLRPQDRVGIVTYGGTAGIYLQPTFGSEKEKIILALDSLVAGGATSGSNGIQLAYELATTNAFTNGINKVILATDGDFNVGATNEAELETLISRYRSTGVTLSCIGVGMGNYKDSKIEVLARVGNGSFAYADTEEEAEKILLQQLGENLFTVAREVTIQIGLNEKEVSNYQLIGYQNKMAALRLSPLRLIGSELSSCQSVVGIVEFAPADTGAIHKSPGYFEIQYKLPDKDSFQQMMMEFPSQITPITAIDSATKTAIALAWMGLELKKAPTARHTSFEGPESFIANLFHPDNKEGRGLKQLLAAIRILYEPPPKKGRRHKHIKDEPASKDDSR